MRCPKCGRQILGRKARRHVLRCGEVRGYVAKRQRGIAFRNARKQALNEHNEVKDGE